MARWVLSPILGDGTAFSRDQTDLTGPYRPYAGKYATSWTCLIPGNPDGTPAFDWCLVRATAGDLVAADADSQLTVFPNLQFDDVLTLAQRTWLVTRLDARGLPSGWVVPGTTFGQALRTIGRYLEARFDIDWLGTVG